MRISAGSDAFSRQPDGTTIADQYRELGIKLTCAYTDRIQGWALIHELLGSSPHGPQAGGDATTKPRLLIHTRCIELIETLPLLQHDPHRPEDLLKVDCDEDGHGGDDNADAFRYLVASKPRKVVMRKLKGF